VRDRRRGGRLRPPEEEDQDNATWKLLWALVGAIAFTVVMLYFDLIRTSEKAPSRHSGE
jgi:hypothetical protein